MALTPHAHEQMEQIAAGTVFFTLELNGLEDAELDAALAAHAGAASWRPWLRQ